MKMNAFNRNIAENVRISLICPTKDVSLQAEKTDCTRQHQAIGAANASQLPHVKVQPLYEVARRRQKEPQKNGFGKSKENLYRSTC